MIEIFEQVRRALYEASLNPWGHRVLVLLCALAIDIVFGEYPNVIHPVVWMGTLIGAIDRIAPHRRRGLALVAGAVIALAVPALFGKGAEILLRSVAPWPGLSFAVEVYLLKSTFALCALGRAAFVMERDIASGDLDGARRDLRSLCSRNAQRLGGPLLTAATIESVAENTSDSFVGPLFAYAIAGVPGAVVYRAVNTLDSMIGYHGKYEYFGKASARLDDLLNLVPARVTAILFLISGGILDKNFLEGIRIVFRDARATESPNAGHPIAAMAGLLGVALEKEGHYRIGEHEGAVRFQLITEAVWVMGVAAALAVLAFLGFCEVGRAFDS